jgi:hypothetical protein
VALSNKVPDVLEESPSGVHISELGRRTGVDEEKLGRVLRLLAAKHIFQEGKSPFLLFFILIFRFFE